MIQPISVQIQHANERCSSFHCTVSLSLGAVAMVLGSVGVSKPGKAVHYSAGRAAHH